MALQQSLWAAIMALMLAVANGAPMVPSGKIFNLLSQKATKDEVADLSKVRSDERLATLMPWARSAIGLAKKSMVVTISEETATRLREAMNKANEELIRNIKNMGSKCGIATINRIEQGERDMPSHFYKVTCPESCQEATHSDPEFREVTMTTVWFKKLESHCQQYEVKFRSQVIGCCLEENTRVPELVTHAVQVTSPPYRR